MSRRDEFALITIDRGLDKVEISDVRAIFFTGAGAREKAFCAGANANELLGRSIPEEYAGMRLGQEPYSCIENFRILSGTGESIYIGGRHSICL